MKIRDGFISIICLIIMSVLMIMILYLEYTTNMEYLILNSTANNIQSYYLAEGKIYMILHEDKYYLNQLYPILAEYFRAYPYSSTPKDIIISNEDLGAGDDLDRVKVNLIDKDGSKQLMLIAKSNFQRLRTTVTSYVTVVNKLFEKGNPILDINLLDIEYKEELIELISNISKNISINNFNKPENIYGVELSNFSTIILDKRDNDTYEIASFRETMSQPYTEVFINKEIFVIIRKFGEEPTNFLIGNSNKPNEEIKLSGIIYVEGDITISKQLEFSGIMIVKDGEIIIDENVKPNIKGIIIVDNIVNNEYIKKADIIYSRHSIYKYGTYLPGVIQPRINLIKNE